MSIRDDIEKERQHQLGKYTIGNDDANTLGDWTLYMQRYMEAFPQRFPANINRRS